MKKQFLFLILALIIIIFLTILSLQKQTRDEAFFDISLSQDSLALK